MKYRVFLDLDDVLVDFIGAACCAHGVEREMMESRRQIAYGNEWSIDRSLALCLDETWPFFHPTPEFRSQWFWKPILNHPDGEFQFWYTLNKLSWADELISLVEKVDPEFQILSSQSVTAVSRAAKVDFCFDVLGVPHDRVWTQHHKEWLSAPNRILIDDRPINCERWRAGAEGTTGGPAILLPSPGEGTTQNKRHWDNPVPYVSRVLADITGQDELFPSSN